MPATPIDALHALILAVLQGISELFPISSLGHAVIVPHLLGWSLDEDSPAFLPFLVMLHVGTATALVLYFWRDWLGLARGLRPGPLPSEDRASRRLLALLVIGTIPAGLVGLLLEKRLAALFGQYQLVAAFLVINGVLLIVGEWLRRRQRARDLSTLSPLQAFGIGISQCLALIPGMSRSGATFVAGLAAGLNHEASARFSFLLATPIIGAAGLLEVPKLLNPDLRGSLGTAMLAGVVAGVVAYLSTSVLMRYFHKSDVNALIPFGVYCMLLGGLALLASAI